MSAPFRQKMLGLIIGGGLALLLLLAGWRLISGADLPAPSVLPPTPDVTPSPPVISETPSPTPSPLPLLPTPSPTVLPPAGTSYTVQEGDTLFAIAGRFGTTVEAIRAANNLVGDTIYPGQVLTIPSGPVGPSLPTPPADDGVILHTVRSGETLSGIAGQYGVTVDAIRAANGLDGDGIVAGQTLRIPVGTPSPAPAWKPSILKGDLSSAYPGILETDRFTLHYTPGTYPAQDLSSVVAMVTRALEHIETVLNGHLDGRFDVYVAGTLFAPPDQALRGQSFSAERRTFFLYDGSGNAADQQYIIAHELTHLFAWNVFGRPSSALLSEGAAVYAGMSLIADSDHVPIRVFCTAYRQAGALPSLLASLRFQGHTRDLPNYYTAGCFAEYLIQTYGADLFGQLYSSGDYTGIYGRSLAALEREWLTDLEASGLSVPFDPYRLIESVESVGTAYDRLFYGFTGTPEQMTAYRTLDAARIALLEGRLDDVEKHLTAFEQLQRR